MEKRNPLVPKESAGSLDWMDRIAGSGHYRLRRFVVGS